jgi:hypothetical protein
MISGQALQSVYAPLLNFDAGGRQEGSSDLRRENFLRSGGSHDPRRLVDGEALDRAPDQIHLADVYTGADTEVLRGRGGANRGGALECRSGGLEDGQHPVARGLYFPAAEPVEFSADRFIVAGQHLPPRSVAESRGRRGGLDQVREEERCQAASPNTPSGADEGSQSLPLDLDHRLVTDDVGVVTRRDVVGVVRTKLQLCTVLADDAEAPRDHHSHVSGSAPLAPDLRAHMLRPSPAGLGHESADREVAELNDPLRGAREGDGLVGRPETPPDWTDHEGMMMNRDPCGQSGLSTQVPFCCASSPRAGRPSKWLYSIPAAKGAAHPQVREGRFHAPTEAGSRLRPLGSMRLQALGPSAPRPDRIPGRPVVRRREYRSYRGRRIVGRVGSLSR